MLHVPSPSYEPWTYDNWGANPAAAFGTSVTAGGTSNTEGSWTQVASSANIAQDVVGFSLRVQTGFASGANRSTLMDIGVDPAGGTSYTEIISNIVCGSSGNIAAIPGHKFLFPFAIKAGSSVAVRIQSETASATLRAAVKFFGQSSRSEFMPNGQFSETIGSLTNSQGQSFTPGNAADGTWTSLGTTTKPMWWWQIAYQVSNVTITAEYTYIDLAYGDGSNKHIIKRIMHGGSTSEAIGDFASTNADMFESFCPVPAGATIYVRGRCNNAPDTGYNALAIGIGG